jgi:hypothetical protein
MITVAIEIVLVLLLLVVVMNLFKKRAQPADTTPQPDLANLRPTDARTGDVISVSGAGDNMSDLDFPVERATKVQAGSRYWVELSGHYRERRTGLRVSDAEDEVTVAVQDGSRNLTLEDLGLSEEDLAQLDERQNPADNFEFDEKSWQYRISREAQATSDNKPPASYYYWEFQEQGGKGLLAIRKLEGEPFSVTMYQEIPASDVTVYRPARG